MDLLPYAARLQRDLLTSARAGGEDAERLAELLSGALESSARLVVLDALVEASAEISAKMAPGSVEVRLRGRDADLVVTTPDAAAVTAPAGATPAVVPDDGDDASDGGTARLSLRLPERLKPRIEEAADAAGISVNAWLVRTVGAALADPRPPTSAPTVHTGQRVTGWAR